MAVHLWSTSLDSPANDLPELLSTDELLRLGKISHARARQAFLRSRVATRRVLAEYLDRGAGNLVFAYNRNGKPTLADDAQGIEFNLSHSGELCLIAVAEKNRIGIDIEPVRKGRDYHALANRFYTPDENQLLDSSADEALFYRIWTLKEAHVKARGLKLMEGLDRFECSCTDNGTLAVVDKITERREAWAQRQWAFAPGYEAALVVLGTEKFQLSHHQLET